jgi:hypothetical protein
MQGNSLQDVHDVYGDFNVNALSGVFVIPLGCVSHLRWPGAVNESVQ